MNCLHCGDCCLRMSPISAPDPCQHLIEMKNPAASVRTPPFYFCAIYDHRPKQCRNHNYQASHCPIGLDKLGFTNSDQVRQRIDTGYFLMKERGGRMKKEIEVAVKWWMDVLRGLASNRVAAFGAALRKTMPGYLIRYGWNIENPNWCSMSRCFGCDYYPDPLLRQAAEAAEISDRCPPFPAKTLMWVDPGSVRVRYGYEAETIELLGGEGNEND